MAATRLQICLCIDADSGVGRLLYVDGNVMREQTELFQALGRLKRMWRQCSEAFQRRVAIRVEAEMFPIDDVAAAVTVEGNGGTRKIKCASVFRKHDLYGIRVGDLFRRAGRPERRHLGVDAGAIERGEQRVDMGGTKHRFVPLYVHDNVRRYLPGYGMNAIRAALQIGRGQHGFPAMLRGQRDHLIRIRRNHHAIEPRCCQRGFDDPLQHGLAGDIAQHLAGQAGGSETGWNNGEGRGSLSGTHAALVSP